MNFMKFISIKPNLYQTEIVDFKQKLSWDDITYAIKFLRQSLQRKFISNLCN